MEHKLIQGGEQYLPFARSRIKAMRATGAKYASQRLVFPDATVRVQIVGQFSYIHITGGVQALTMDSGVIDALSIAEANPSAYLPGVLHETDLVAAYNAAFVLPDSGDPPRRNPGAGSAGQLAGIVTIAGGRFVGAVPVDGEDAQSFAPAHEENPSPPPDWVYATEDAVLFAKKRIAVLCPASMFTGRCRLYVQALYGQHMVSAIGKTSTLQYTLADSARPALQVNNRRAGLPPVLVTTSSGVYFDPTSGKHWLFTFEDGAKAYPLKAPAGVESMRVNLVAENSKLTAEDQERLEAYVLSACLPAGDGSGIITGSADNPYSMGYGWHWNWDGLVADAVTHTEVEQGGDRYYLSAQWLRIQIEQPEPGQFTVTQSAVQPAASWCLERTYWTVAEPEWSSFTLVKSTPKLTNLFECQAVIYAFYNRNELQTCEVTVTLEPASPAAVVYDNCSGTDVVTVGLNEGSRSEVDPGTEYYSATFTCGGLTTQALPLGQELDYPSVTEVKNKVPGIWTAGTGSEAFGTRTFPVSDDYGGSATSVTAYVALVDANQNRQISFQTSVSSILEESYGVGTMVVPFYDAEAVYLQAAIERTRTVYGNVTYNLNHNGGGTIDAFLIRNAVTSDFVTTEYYSYAQGAGGLPSANHTLESTTSVIPDPVVTTTYSTAKLISRAGQHDATFPNIAQFRDNSAENISSAYYTLTGALSGSLAAVIGTENGISSGLNGATPAAPILVGIA